MYLSREKRVVRRLRIFYESTIKPKGDTREKQIKRLKKVVYGMAKSFECSRQVNRC